LRYGFVDFVVDVGARTLSRGAEPLTITARVFDTLVLLLDRAGTVVEKEEFFRRVWRETAVEDGNLTQTIFVLRKLLGDQDQRIIVTLPGRGYIFTARVETIEALPDQGSPTAEVNSRAGHRPVRRLPNVPVAPVAVLGIALLVVASFFVSIRLTRMHSAALPPATQTVRFRVPIPETLHLAGSGGFSLSPDGRTLAYLAAGPDGVLRVWVQSLDSLDPKLLSGTEVLSGDPTPFWSPDSKFVAFYSGEKLKKTDLKGNPPQTICSIPGILIGGSWNREGVIIFGRTTGGLMRVSDNGGDAVPLTTRDSTRRERVHGGPSFLPDDRHFLYSRFSSARENEGVYVGSLDAKPGEQGLTQALATSFGVQFVASPGGNGKLLFLRENSLWSQEFDVFRLALIGEPALVLGQVGHNPAFGWFAASANALVYRNAPDEEMAQMAWFDRRGKQSDLFGESVTMFSQPVLSPDGSRVAMAKFDGGNVDVWVYDLARNVNQRLTSDPALDDSPVWSHDGKRVAFASSRAGHYDLYQVAANGEGREELLYASGENKFPTSWSPDGHYLLYVTQARETNGDIWVLPFDGISKHSPVPLVHTRANEGDGTVSPDARWLAYVSDDSGIAEVYVQPFTLPSASVDSPDGPKVLVSKKGGRRPRWRADGKELFYNSPDGTLMSVAVTSGPTFHPGIPQLLFRTPAAWFSRADARSDGTRFLVAIPVEQTSQSFTVVLNWQSELAAKK
jgi:Tol biopolymer transport system component/DNA-binding winged helix-turn-helix (wHTH) protein